MGKGKIQEKKEIKLTRKQKKYCDLLLEWKSQTQAAIETYNVKHNSTARSMWSENMTKPSIRAYLEDKWDKAWSVIEKIMDADDTETRVKLDAAKYIYDQAHWRAVAKVELAGKDWGNIKIEDTNSLTLEDVDLALQRFFQKK